MDIGPVPICDHLWQLLKDAEAQEGLDEPARVEAHSRQCIFHGPKAKTGGAKATQIQQYIKEFYAGLMSFEHRECWNSPDEIEPLSEIRDECLSPIISRQRRGHFILSKFPDEIDNPCHDSLPE